MVFRWTLLCTIVDIYRKLQIYFDLLYDVNHLELGVNDILQLIELVLGEGNICT